MPHGYELQDERDYVPSSRGWNPFAGLQRMVEVPWTAAQAERTRQQNLQDKLMEAGIVAPAGAPTGGLTRFFGGPRTQLNPIDVAGAVQQKQLADAAAKKQEQMDLFKVESDLRSKAAKETRDQEMASELYKTGISAQRLAKANGWTGKINDDVNDPSGVASATIEATKHMWNISESSKEADYIKKQIEDALRNPETKPETIRMYQDKLQKAQDKYHGLLNPDDANPDHAFKQDNTPWLQAKPIAQAGAVKTPEEMQAIDEQKAKEEKKLEPFISEALLLGIPKEELEDKDGNWKTRDEIVKLISDVRSNPKPTESDMRNLENAGEKATAAASKLQEIKQKAIEYQKALSKSKSENEKKSIKKELETLDFGMDMEKEKRDDHVFSLMRSMNRPRMSQEQKARAESVFNSAAEAAHGNREDEGVRRSVYDVLDGGNVEPEKDVGTGKIINRTIGTRKKIADFSETKDFVDGLRSFADALEQHSEKAWKKAISLGISPTVGPNEMRNYADLIEQTGVSRPRLPWQKTAPIPQKTWWQKHLETVAEADEPYRIASEAAQNTHGPVWGR